MRERGRKEAVGSKEKPAASLLAQKAFSFCFLRSIIPTKKDAIFLSLCLSLKTVFAISLSKIHSVRLCSKFKLGKRENHEKQTFGSWLTAAPVCFQAPRTAPAKFVAVSSGGRSVWRWWRFSVKEEMRTTICVAVVEVRREGRDEKRGMA